MDRINWLSFKKKTRRFRLVFETWILIFAILLSNISSVVGAEFKSSVTVSNSRGVFKEEPKNVVASLGETVELPCLIVDENGRRLQTAWTFEGSVENVAILPHFKASNGSLFLKNVGLIHEGTYRCAVLIKSPTFGVLLSVSANVSVARIRSFIEEPQDFVAPVGGVARFSCLVDATPPATVGWYHNDIPVVQNDSRFRLLSSGILQIVNVETSDQGYYHCLASNGFGNVTSRSASLTTSNKPRSSSSDLTLNVLRAPQNVSTTRGRDAFFECIFANVPHPSVVWRRTDGGVFPVTARQIGSNLHITSVEPWYDGQYECSAQLAENEIQLKANLSVDSSPEIREFPQEHMRKRGESARFTCNTASKPISEITWYKNGELVQPKGRVKMYPTSDLPPERVVKPSGDVEYKRDLLISSVRQEDAAVYECFASNYLGEVGGAAVLVYLEDDGPSDPPENLRATISQSEKTIRLTWNIPSELSDKGIAAFIVHFHSNVNGDVENTHAVEPKEACTNGVCRTPCCGVTTSLKAYTNYTFWVSALLTNGVFTLPSNETVITTWDEVTTAPAPLMIQEMNESGSVRLLWDSLSPSLQRGEAVEYRIEYKEAGSEMVSVHHVPYVIKEYALTNLKLNVVYYFRVIPKTRAGYPAVNFVPKDFAWLKFRLRSNASSITSSSAPMLVASVLNSTAIYVEFRANSAESSSDEFRVILTKVETLSDENSLVILNVTSSTVPTVIGSLEPFTLYQIYVSAIMENGGQGLVSSRTVRTLAVKGDEDPKAPVPPLVPYPKDIACQTSRTGRLRVTWSQPQPYDPIKYTVRYSLTTDGDELLNVSSIKFKETTVNSTTFTDMLAGRSYLIAVKTEANVGWSKFSDDITCTIPATAISAPQGVSSLVLSNSSVLLTWTPSGDAVAEDIIQYHVRYRIDGESTANGARREIIVNGTQHKVVLSDLLQAEIYFVSIAAETESSGIGQFSIPIPVVIPATSTTTKIVVVERTSYTEGIVIGVCIAVVCVFVVLIFKARRNNRGGWSWRVCPWSTYSSENQNGAGPSKAPPHNNGHVPNGHCSRDYDTKVEMMTLLPPLVENSTSDAKGGNDLASAGLRYMNGFSQQVAVNGLPKPLLMQANNPLTVTIDSPDNGNIVQPNDQSSDLSQSAATGSSLHSWSLHCTNGGAGPSSSCNHGSGNNNNNVYYHHSNGYCGGNHGDATANANRRSNHSNAYSSMPNLTDSGIGFDEVVICCNGHHYSNSNSSHVTNNNNNNVGKSYTGQNSITPPATNGDLVTNNNSSPPQRLPSASFGAKNGFCQPKSNWLQDFFVGRNNNKTPVNGMLIDGSTHQGTATC